MTDALFALVPVWGAWALAAATFLSCLAVPIPSSLLMLAGGAFAASGDLTLWSVVFAAWVGAVVGDQAGFALGHFGRRIWQNRPVPSAGMQAMITRAQAYLQRRGGLAVFLSRWLVSPLGPYINLLAGAGGLSWYRFSLGSLSGEAVWVALYVLLGWLFSTQIETIADLASNAVGLLATLAIAAGLWRLRRAHRPGPKANHKARIQT